MDKFVEINNMKNRMIKGCAVECSGACGDCSRTGEPLDLKGRLFLATGEIDETAIDKFCELLSGEKRFYLVSSDCDRAKATSAFEAIKARLGGKAYCFASDDYPVEDGKLFARMADLKDEENISLRPSACAGFEGLRPLVEAEGFPAPDEDSVVVVWALAGAEASLEEMLEYYEKAKRM